MRRFILGMAMLGLAGCSGQNANITTLQLSGAAEAFPDRYQSEAARVVATRTVPDGAGVQVSYPQTTLGVTAFSPQRWYVCVVGLTGPAPDKKTPPVLSTVTAILDPQSKAGVYNLVLVFSQGMRPSLNEGYDSPLCRNAAYEELTAEPPLI